VSATCPVCYARQDAGLLCDSCTEGLRIDLRGNASIIGVAELADNLQVAQAKQARLGETGGRKGEPLHERLPINVGAMEAARNLEYYLGSWARDLTDDKWRPSGQMRAVRNRQGSPGPYCPTCRHQSCASRREYQFAPNRYIAAQAAAVLLDHLDDIRKHGAVRELIDEITKAIERGRNTLDVEPFSRFPVGPCPEDGCGRTVFALCPAEGSHRPAFMACYQMVPGENRPDLGAGFTLSWTSIQFYRVGARIRRKIDTRSKGAA